MMDVRLVETGHCTTKAECCCCMHGMSACSGTRPYPHADAALGVWETGWAFPGWWKVDYSLALFMTPHALQLPCMQVHSLFC